MSELAANTCWVDDSVEACRTDLGWLSLRLILWLFTLVMYLSYLCEVEEGAAVSDSKEREPSSCLTLKVG